MVDSGASHIHILHHITLFRPPRCIYSLSHWSEACRRFPTQGSAMATEYEPLKFVGKGASWLFERKNMNQSLLAPSSSCCSWCRTCIPARCSEATLMTMSQLLVRSTALNLIHGSAILLACGLFYNKSYHQVLGIMLCMVLGMSYEFVRICAYLTHKDWNRNPPFRNSVVFPLTKMVQLSEI